MGAERHYIVQRFDERLPLSRIGQRRRQTAVVESGLPGDNEFEFRPSLAMCDSADSDEEQRCAIRSACRPTPMAAAGRRNAYGDLFDLADAADPMAYSLATPPPEHIYVDRLDVDVQWHQRRVWQPRYPAVDDHLEQQASAGVPFDLGGVQSTASVRANPFWWPLGRACRANRSMVEGILVAAIHAGARVRVADVVRRVAVVSGVLAPCAIACNQALPCGRPPARAQFARDDLAAATYDPAAFLRDAPPSHDTHRDGVERRPLRSSDSPGCTGSTAGHQGAPPNNNKTTTSGLSETCRVGQARRNLQLQEDGWRPAHDRPWAVAVAERAQIAVTAAAQSNAQAVVAQALSYQPPLRVTAAPSWVARIRIGLAKMRMQNAAKLRATKKAQSRSSPSQAKSSAHKCQRDRSQKYLARARLLLAALGSESLCPRPGTMAADDYQALSQHLLLHPTDAWIVCGVSPRQPAP
jgi:hypothetical protein